MTLARRTFHALNSSFRRLDSSCRHAGAARRWFNCAATHGTSLMHNVSHGALRGVSLAYVALRHRQTPQNIHQHLRVNPRRNLTIAEIPDANASRPINYVGTLVLYD
jgi:hypothetical protein